jgi:hypothetical protein
VARALSFGGQHASIPASTAPASAARNKFVRIVAIAFLPFIVNCQLSIFPGFAINSPEN